MTDRAGASFWGEVSNSFVVTASGSVEISLATGTVLSVRPEDWSDFSSDIDRLTRDFYGRGFIFQALVEFIGREPRGYFRIIADAGLGKSAIAAELVKRYTAPACFVSATVGRTRPEQILTILCVQVIIRYGLPYTALPARAGETSDWLRRLLAEAARRPENLPVVIVVDALDEADPTPHGHNWLHLPSDLPEGVYVVLTHRPGDYPLRMAPGLPSDERTVTWDEPDQRQDIEGYLRHRTKQPAIHDALAAATPPISADRFVATLRDVSEGNFMYLQYTLDDIASKAPGFHPLRLERLQRLPKGLRGYYEEFWSGIERMLDTEGYDEWSGLYRPVIALLGAAGEPVTIEWLADHTGRSAPEIAERALRRWRRFLSRGLVKGTATWRIIHQSFADFLGDKLPLSATHRAIASFYQDHRDRWLAHQGYGLRQLSSHLRWGSERERLFALVDDDDWYGAQMAADPSGSAFLRDLDQAWSMAEAEDLEQAKRSARAPLLSCEVRFALATAGMHSRAQTIPAELLLALVANDRWTPEEGLAAARQIPDGMQRTKSLVGLAHHLPPQLADDALREALDAARAARENRRSGGPAVALAEVFPKLQASRLPDALRAVLELDDEDQKLQALVERGAPLPPALLRRALEAAAGLRPDWRRADALKGLTQRLPDALLEEVRAAAGTIQDDAERAMLLVHLAPRLPKDTVEEIVAEVKAIEDEAVRVDALVELLPHVPGLQDEVLTAARAIADDAVRASALIALAAHVPGLQEEALESVLRADNEITVARGVKRLAPLLSPTQRTRALDAVLAIQDTYAWTNGIVGLARYLSGPSLERALSAIATYGDAYARGNALRGLTSHLSGSLTAVALKIVPTVDYVDNRDLALAGLVERLPESLVETALDQALTTTTRWPHHGRALAALLPRLSGPLFERALTAIVEDKLLHSDPLHQVLDRLSASRRQAILDQVTAGRSAPALLELARRLSGREREQVLEAALDAARSIGSNQQRASWLTEVATELPTVERRKVLDEALRAAEVIGDERSRLEAQVALARYVPTSLLRAPLQRILAIEDLQERVALLSAITAHADVEDLAKAYTDTLAAVGEGRDWDRRVVLDQLPVDLHPALLPEALAVARAIEKPDDRAAALTGLLSRLPGDAGELLAEALSAGRAIKHPLPQARRLVALLPLTDASTRERLVNEALERVRMSEEGEDRAELLVSLVTWLTPSARPTLIPEALEAALAAPTISLGPSSRTDLLKALAPSMTESDFGRALEWTGSADPWDAADVLSALGPHLPSSLLGRAITIATAIPYDAHVYGDKALAAILPRQAEVGDALKALDRARAIEHEGYRARAVVAVATRLHDPLRSEAVAEGFAAVIQLPESSPIASSRRSGSWLPNTSWQAEALEQLAPLLPEQSLPEAVRFCVSSLRPGALAGLVPGLVRVGRGRELFALWSEALRGLALRTRADVLAELGGLAPVVETLADDRTIVEIFKAVDAVGRRWP